MWRLAGLALLAACGLSTSAVALDPSSPLEVLRDATVAAVADHVAADWDGQRYKQVVDDVGVFDGSLRFLVRNCVGSDPSVDPCEDRSQWITEIRTVGLSELAKAEIFVTEPFEEPLADAYALSLGCKPEAACVLTAFVDAMETDRLQETWLPCRDFAACEGAVQALWQLVTIEETAAWEASEPDLADRGRTVIAALEGASGVFDGSAGSVVAATFLTAGLSTGPTLSVVGELCHADEVDHGRCLTSGTREIMFLDVTLDDVDPDALAVTIPPDGSDETFMLELECRDDAGEACVRHHDLAATTDLGGWSFVCRNLSACLDALDALQVLVRGDAKSAAPEDAAPASEISGSWELYVPQGPAAFMRWQLEFSEDGTYAFSAGAEGPRHEGRYVAADQRWSMAGRWTRTAGLPPGTPEAYTDEGSYRLLDTNAMELVGRQGGAVWHRSASN